MVTQGDASSRKLNLPTDLRCMAMQTDSQVYSQVDASCQKMPFKCYCALCNIVLVIKWPNGDASRRKFSSTCASVWPGLNNEYRTQFGCIERTFPLTLNFNIRSCLNKRESQNIKKKIFSSKGGDQLTRVTIFTSIPPPQGILNFFFWSPLNACQLRLIPLFVLQKSMWSPKKSSAPPGDK